MKFLKIGLVILGVVFNYSLIYFEGSLFTPLIFLGSFIIWKETFKLLEELNVWEWCTKVLDKIELWLLKFNHKYL